MRPLTATIAGHATRADTGLLKATPAGFTLLEIMIALSLMAIVLVSVYRMHAQTLRLNEEIRFNATAPLLAQAKIAELALRPPGSLTDGEGDFGDDFPGYTWRILSAEAELPAEVDLPGRLLQVDLAVAMEPANRMYHLRTYTYLGP